jgi:hypothetical protein
MSLSNKESIENNLKLINLSEINDRFTRMFRLTMSAALREVVEISTPSSEIHEFGSFLKSVPIPANLHIFSMFPFGNALLIFDSQALSSLVDLFCGGHGTKFSHSGEDYTAIECSFAKRFTLGFIEDYAMAWQAVYPIKVVYRRYEIFAPFVRMFPDDEAVVVTTLKVTLDDVSVPLTMCFSPFLLKPLFSQYKILDRIPTTWARDIKDIVKLGLKRTALPSWWNQVKPRIHQKIKIKFPLFYPSEPMIQSEKDSVETVQEKPLEKISLAGCDPKKFAAYAPKISREHPQVIALILSQLTTVEQSKRALKLMSEDLKATVLNCIATMKSVPPEVIDTIETILYQSINQTSINEPPSGFNKAQQIFQTLGKGSEKKVLSKLKKINPGLAEKFEKSE